MGNSIQITTEKRDLLVQAAGYWDDTKFGDALKDADIQVAENYLQALQPDRFGQINLNPDTLSLEMLDALSSLVREAESEDYGDSLKDLREGLQSIITTRLTDNLGRSASRFQEPRSWRNFSTELLNDSIIPDIMRQIILAAAPRDSRGYIPENLCPFHDIDMRKVVANILRQTRGSTDDRVNAVVRTVSYFRPSLSRADVLSELRDGQLLGSQINARGAEAWKAASRDLFDAHLTDIRDYRVRADPGWILLASLDSTLSEPERWDLVRQAGLVFNINELDALRGYNCDASGVLIGAFHEDSLSVFEANNGRMGIAPGWEDLQDLRRNCPKVSGN